jgi:hypothetical protein
MSTILKFSRLSLLFIPTRALSIRLSSSASNRAAEPSSASHEPRTEPSERSDDAAKETPPTSSDSHLKSVSERDAELQAKFRERLGGMETEAFEDGKPVEGLRRNVKENMFRLI